MRPWYEHGGQREDFMIVDEQAPSPLGPPLAAIFTSSRSQGDALDAHTKATDDQLTDHEHRITTLEQAA
jgi:hypothetical protein